MKTGWYFNIGRKEYFVKTEYQNKTNLLAGKILDKLGFPNNPDSRKELMYYMVKANLEIKHCKPRSELKIEEFDYYYISGKNFCGYGTKVDDGMTIVIQIEK